MRCRHQGERGGYNDSVVLGAEPSYKSDVPAAISLAFPALHGRVAEGTVF